MLARRLRRSLVATAVSGVAVLALTAAPAAAVGTTAAEINADFHFSPYPPFLPLASCGTIAFVASPNGSIGAFTAGSQTAAGVFTTSIITGGTTAYPLPQLPTSAGFVSVGCGATATENWLAGSGSINPFTFVSTGPVGSVSGSCGTGGTYLRISRVILFDFTGCTATVTGPLGGTATTTFGPPGDLRMVGVFSVSSGEISNYVFTGLWTGITAT